MTQPSNGGSHARIYAENQRIRGVALIIDFERQGLQPETLQILPFKSRTEFIEFETLEGGNSALQN
ncbi:hypothetical protein [Alicycliphilus denitrificans]|uniref:hypothetical protein n=1 Tax=Alicycliphilus denitrificans TaxID=179636 RepID=UPI000B2854C4|nr:hypothetical protein [Alicycliphilus denitrificans]MBN9575126.1 hypothetical protein [Alicycliphilus denitrificans]